MGLLAEAFNPRPRANAEDGWTDWSPLDDRWYMPAVGVTAAGVPVSAETLFYCDVVKAAVQFKADAVAVCSPQVFRRQGQDRKAEPNHYAQRVLRDPNAWQTGFEWAHLNVTWLSIFGNAYNRIVGSSTSFVDELYPLHPACVRISKRRRDGAPVYAYQNPETHHEEELQQEAVLHYRGISMDGVSGMEIYRLIRNAVGIALAAERHTATFLRKGSRLAGLLVPAGPLDKEQRKELRDSVNSDLGGANNTGTLGVMPFGVTLTPMASTNRNAQFLELSNHYVEKILRHLGVPGVVVGYQGDKSSTYASAKEFFESGGIKHCILPLVMNMEQRDDKVLLPGQEGLFIKRNLGVLMRASTKETFELAVKAAGRPILTGNEARALLDLNRDAAAGMDEVMRPENMSDGLEPEEPEAGPVPPSPPRQLAPAPPDQQDDDARARAVVAAEERAVLEAKAAKAERLLLIDARRIVRREAAAIAAKAPCHARNESAWRAWVTDYYEKHATHVAEALEVPEGVARAYCARQAAVVLEQGVGIVEAWEKEVAPRLVAMALGE